MSRLPSLRSGASALAYWSGAAGATRRQIDAARIVIFHGTPASRVAELEAQLRYLRRQFNVIALSELLKRLDGPAGSLRGCVAVTFDDGRRNNATVAYPVLRRLGIPATFFVCPGLIEQGAWLWNCEARQRLRYAPAGLRRELAQQFGVRPDVESVIGWMKTLGTTERRKAEDAIRQATPDYAPTARERHELDLADWAALRALDPALVEIGSHTMHHPILPCLTAQEMDTELGESRRMLQARLQRPVDTLAYPNGAHNALVREIARRHYPASVSCDDGLVAPAAGRHAVPRFSAPQGALRLALLANRLGWPAAGGSLEPLGAAAGKALEA